MNITLTITTTTPPTTTTPTTTTTTITIITVIIISHISFTFYEKTVSKFITLLISVVTIITFVCIFGFEIKHIFLFFSKFDKYFS